VARCTKIINPNTEEAKYVINVKQIAKFVVGLGDKVAPTDIEEGMRVGVDRQKYQVGLTFAVPSLLPAKMISTPCLACCGLAMGMVREWVLNCRLSTADSNPPASQDRPLCDHDDRGGEARCHVLRHWYVQWVLGVGQLGSAGSRAVVAVMK
jgi:hypothetical protein